MNQSRLPTERQRVLYACSTIRGDAYAYVQHIVDSSHQFTPAPELDNFNAFMKLLETVYAPVDQAGEAVRQVRALRHKKGQTVESYAAEFRKWSGLTGWGQKELVSTFYENLQIYVKDLLIHDTAPETLEEMIRLAALKDSRHRANHSTHPVSSTVNMPPTSDPNAMDLSRLTLNEIKKKLSTEERERREKEGLCMNCARPKHRAFQCRLPFSAVKAPSWKPRAATVSVASASTVSSSEPTTSALSNETAAQLIAALRAINESLGKSGLMGSDKGKEPVTSLSSDF